MVEHYLLMVIHNNGVDMKQFEISELDKLSALSFANIFNVNDEPKLGPTFKTYSINRTLNFTDLNDTTTTNNSLFIPYKVIAEDNWTIISFKFYQTIELWWLIAKVNNIADPTVDPIVGSTIKILKSDVVNQILSVLREE